jgi:hypothetical protein
MAESISDARDDAPDAGAPLVVWTPCDCDGYMVPDPIYEPHSDPAEWAAIYDEKFPEDAPHTYQAWVRVPSPDVLRAECEALANAIEDCEEYAGDPEGLLYRPEFGAILATLRTMLQRQRALLVAVTRDDAGEGR